MRGLPTILPTTKQAVGNGHLQTDLDGENKKPCIFKQVTGHLRHSWTGKKLFDVLDLFAHLLNQYLDIDCSLGGAYVNCFGAKGVGLAVQLLHQEVQPAADRLLAIEYTAHLVKV